MITEEQKQMVKDNITHYVRNNCVMSKHSLDIIEMMMSDNEVLTKKNEGLIAHVERLRDGIIEAQCLVEKTSEEAACKLITELWHETPAHSLQAIKAAARNEVIETMVAASSDPCEMRHLIYSLLG